MPTQAGRHVRAIDLLSDKLDRLLVKHKKKMVDHHRGESAARSGNFA
jgi:putative sigma-54 modulation protein